MERQWSNLKVLKLYTQEKLDLDIPSCLGLEKFMKTVGTIGNLLPIPPAFQSRGISSSKDYWDFALLCIYQYYQTQFDFSWILREGKSVKICKQWLDAFHTWDNFVEENFLQDFVNQKAGGEYDPPKELWKGHFSGPVLPNKQEDFEQFFTNASAWILARGTRMVIALRKREAQDKKIENSTKEDA